MKRSWMMLVAGVLALSSCDGWTLKERGSEGEPCFTNGECDAGLTCVAGTCQAKTPDCVESQTSCDGTWTRVCQGGVWVRISDCAIGDKVCEDGKCLKPSTDGDEGDGDLSDGDVDEVVVDGDHDDHVEAEEEPGCVCGPGVTDCCDGCDWTTSACTPSDEHALGGHCDSGYCLINQCANGWHVAEVQLTCEPNATDGDEEADVSDEDLDGTDRDVMDGDHEEDFVDAADGDEPDGDQDPDLTDGDVDLDPDAELDSDPDLELDPDPDPEIEEEEQEPGTDCTSGDCCNNGHWVAVGDPCVSGQDAFACTADACDAAHECSVHTLLAGHCLINSVCYDEHQAKPGFQCVWCDPTSAPTGWTDKPGTESCNDGNLCTYGEKCDGNGACSPGTTVTCLDNPGVCEANKTCNGTDQCTVSYPDNQTTCETDNKTCTDDKCNGAGTCDHIRQSNTCYIGGVCYAHHAVNPGNECQWCDSTANTWADKPSSESCTDDGKTCTTDHCSGGSCVHDRIAGKCLIENTCYSDSMENPTHECQYCDAYNSPTAWRNKQGGTLCGDGPTECSNQDTCDAGLCQPNHLSDTTNCGDAETQCVNQDKCDGNGSCSDKGFKADGMTCGTQDQCYQGACVDCTNLTGCVDLADDGLECSDPACNTTTHACYHKLDAHWGELCGDGADTACTNPDTCDASGVCQPNHETNGMNCDDGDKCNGISTCQSGSCNQTTEPVTCTAHATCNTSTGTCSCNVGYTGANCDACSSGYHDESGLCITDGFKRINAGTFMMGSPAEELGREADETQHSVKLTYSFEMQAKEVTQAELTAFSGTNPSWFGPNGDGGNCGNTCPVERVSWYDAIAYANWRSNQNGLTPCYVLNDCTGTAGVGCPSADFECTGDYSCTVTLNQVSIPQQCVGFRLPTEAEWEYAARAGTTTAYHDNQGSDSSHLECQGPFHLQNIAIYCYNDYGSTHTTGTKTSNAWGLYDMSGNVWERVWDKYCSDYTVYGDDPDAATCSGTGGIIKGGSWTAYAQDCRSAERDQQGRKIRRGSTGFRLVRSLP